MRGMTRRMNVTVGLLVAGSLLNLAILAQAPGGIQPIRIHESNELRHLVQVEQRSLHRGFELYLALREHGSGMRLVAPAGTVDPTHVDGLADMELEPEASSVILDQQRSETLVSGAIDGGEFVITGEESPRPFHLVEPHPDAGTLILAFTSDGAIVVVDEITLAGTEAASDG